jgi:hypothetical protein
MASNINCTIVRNSSGLEGAGLYSLVPTNPPAGQPTAYRNLIVYDNRLTNGTASDLVNTNTGWETGFAYCTSPSLTDGVRSNLTSDPLFKTSGSGYGTNLVLGNYHLISGSPCMDTATNEAWMSTSMDVEGAARIQGTAPDRGAYETVIWIIKGSIYSIR